MVQYAKPFGVGGGAHKGVRMGQGRKRLNVFNAFTCLGSECIDDISDLDTDVSKLENPL